YTVTPAQKVLLDYVSARLAQYTGGGYGLVVGVSEMSRLNLDGYLEIYSIFKSRLPNAEYMYYASLDQDPSSVAQIHDYLQSHGIKLKYLGYSLYPYPSYDYSGGSISIPATTMQTLTQLKNLAEARGSVFFIGEVGFRNGDLEGWLYPYDYSGYRRFAWAEGYAATVRYYVEAIRQARALTGIIGIWNLDGKGDLFGLWTNPYISALYTNLVATDTINLYPYLIYNTTMVYGDSSPHGPFGGSAGVVDVAGGSILAGAVGRATSTSTGSYLDVWVVPQLSVAGVKWDMVGKYVISVGGPLVNTFTYVFNPTDRIGYGGLPFYFDTKRYLIVDARDGSTYGPGHFVVAMLYVKEVDRYVMLVWGYGGLDTYAAAVWLTTHPLPNTGAVLVRWSDSNHNGIPDIGDEFVVVKSW
ncbi:MAG: hypothetical protein ACP5MH_11950, partial [Thermoproteus sp.]